MTGGQRPLGVIVIVPIAPRVASFVSGDLRVDPAGIIDLGQSAMPLATRRVSEGSANASSANSRSSAKLERCSREPRSTR